VPRPSASLPRNNYLIAGDLEAVLKRHGLRASVHAVVWRHGELFVKIRAEPVDGEQA
jgi:hypothetical protein